MLVNLSYSQPQCLTDCSKTFALHVKMSVTVGRCVRLPGSGWNRQDKRGPRLIKVKSGTSCDWFMMTTLDNGTFRGNPPEADRLMMNMTI